MLALVSVFSCLATLTLLCCAAWTDLRRRLIANRISIATVVLCLCWWLSSRPLGGEMLLTFVTTHLAAGLAVFCATFLLWLRGGFGGGDVKLLSAVSIWAGFDNLLPTLTIVAAVGGLLALTQLVMSRFLPRFGELVFEGGTLDAGTGAWVAATAAMAPARSDASGDTQESNARRQPDDADAAIYRSVPYGVAIAIGGAWVLNQSIRAVGF